jgi:Phage protein Gp19/Gp15/Gp42
MTYAPVDDVATRLGRPITEPPEVAQVEAWLADTELLILARVPDLDALVAAGDPTQGAVVMVESNAVVRMVRNPDGKTQERIDDYSWGLPANPQAGTLYLTDTEWGLLEPGASEGAWTIRPYAATGAGTWLTPDVWVPAP